MATSALLAQVLDVCDRVSRDGGEDGALARDAHLVAGMAIDAAREASEASAEGKASLDETLWIVEEVRIGAAVLVVLAIRGGASLAARVYIYECTILPVPIIFAGSGFQHPLIVSLAGPF